jgi:hypothetical protein
VKSGEQFKRPASVIELEPHHRSKSIQRRHSEVGFRITEELQTFSRTPSRRQCFVCSVGGEPLLTWHRNSNHSEAYQSSLRQAYQAITETQEESRWRQFYPSRHSAFKRSAPDFEFNPLASTAHRVRAK